MNDSEFFDNVGTGVRENGTGLRENGRPTWINSTAAEEPEQSSKSNIRETSVDDEIKRWATNSNYFWQASKTIERLDAGFYRVDAVPDIGIALRKKTIATDDLMRLPDSTSDAVINEFGTFWSLKEKFKTRGFLHKRGILLWGPPGSGKTASLMLMAHDIVNKLDGIVVEIEHPKEAAMGLDLVRRIEPDRPVIAFLEDLDALVERWGENSFLSLLDGETQVDNIVYVATTNYPERLDRRFVDRPSRFDTVKFIGMPTAEARRLYLKTKEPSLTEDDLKLWVENTDGFSIAHLRELVILVQCFERPLEEAIERLETMRMRRPSSEDSPEKPQFGFGASKRPKTEYGEATKGR